MLRKLLAYWCSFILLFASLQEGALLLWYGIDTENFAAVFCENPLQEAPLMCFGQCKVEEIMGNDELPERQAQKGFEGSVLNCLLHNFSWLEQQASEHPTDRKLNRPLGTTHLFPQAFIFELDRPPWQA
ncbi:MAG: hypothetical protein AAF433_22025 [Bacteroidota bacterium]